MLLTITLKEFPNIKLSIVEHMSESVKNYYIRNLLSKDSNVELDNQLSNKYCEHLCKYYQTYVCDFVLKCKDINTLSNTWQDHEIFDACTVIAATLEVPLRNIACIYRWQGQRTTIRENPKSHMQHILQIQEIWCKKRKRNWISPWSNLRDCWELHDPNLHSQLSRHWTQASITRTPWCLRRWLQFSDIWETLNTH